MEALHDTIRAGKARYIGASSMYAWQFAKLQHAADLGGWTRFVSMQNQYNLLRRHDEPELMAMCGDMGVGWCPTPQTAKADSPARRVTEPPIQHRQSRASVRLALRRTGDQRGAELAESRGVSMAQIALAWVLATLSSRRQSSARPSPTTYPRPPTHST